MPALRKQDARIALAEMTGTAVRANNRLAHCSGWYNNLRKQKVTQ